MKKSTDIILRILGASSFTCVSGVAMVFIATHLLPYVTTAHDLSSGEEPSNYVFFVVAEFPGQSIMVPLRFREIPKFQKTYPEVQFNLTHKSGELLGEAYSSWRYEANDDASHGQYVEVQYRDDDLSSVSRYRVRDNMVLPLYSRFMSPSHMFMAFPIAIAFAFFVRFVARRLRKRWSLMLMEHERA